MESSPNVVNIEKTEDEEEEKEGNYDDEYIQMLLNRETQSSGRQRKEISHPDWVLMARLDGVHYILKTRERLRFRVQTAYASVIYLDRFLSRRCFDEGKHWAVRLLSMACISLAAKMEEIKVPALPEFCWEDYTFSSSAVQRMELLVLNTLEWGMGLVSPFGFIHFFADKFLDDSPRDGGVCRIMEVILGTMRDMKVMCYRPSVLAAAATLVALNQVLTRDALHFKITPLTSSFPLQIEEIIGCFYQIQETDKERRLRLIRSPDLSPNQLHTDLATSSVTSSGKRKRLLSINEDDENGDAPDNKKREP